MELRKTPQAWDVPAHGHGPQMAVPDADLLVNRHTTEFDEHVSTLDQEAVGLVTRLVRFLRRPAEADPLDNDAATIAVFHVFR